MNYHIIDTEFNKKFSSAYQLSILAGMDSLVYSIQESAHQKELVFRTHTFQNDSYEQTNIASALSEIFSNDELFGYLYRRVKICLPFSPAVLVPERLFNEKEKKTYVSELTDLPENDAVLTDQLQELSTRVIYSVNSAIYGDMRKKFPNALFYSPVSPFLLHCRQLNEGSKSGEVYAHFQKGCLHLAVFEQQNLKFYNTFKFNFAEDVLYYILMVYDQFKLETSSGKIHLSGNILQDSEIYKLLYRHISSVGFLQLPSYIQFGRSFSEIPAHFYSLLFALSLCK